MDKNRQHIRTIGHLTNILSESLRCRANDEHTASGVAVIIALSALDEAVVVFFFCSEMVQLTPPGTKQSSGRGRRREGPCQAAGSVNCGTSPTCWIELDIPIRLADWQKLRVRIATKVRQDGPNHKTHREYHGRPL